MSAVTRRWTLYATTTRHHGLPRLSAGWLVPQHWLRLMPPPHLPHIPLPIRLVGARHRLLSHSRHVASAPPAELDARHKASRSNSTRRSVTAAAQEHISPPPRLLLAHRLTAVVFTPEAASPRRRSSVALYAPQHQRMHHRGARSSSSPPPDDASPCTSQIGLPLSEHAIVAARVMYAVASSRRSADPSGCSPP